MMLGERIIIPRTIKQIVRYALKGPLGDFLPSSLTATYRPGFAFFKRYNNRYQNLPNTIAGLIPTSTISDGGDVRILDLGCGELWHSFPLYQDLYRRTGKGMDVTFVDTSPAIERFMGKFLKRPPVWLHQNQLLLADAKEYLQTCPQTHFDIVLAVHMIFHILKQDWGIFFTQGMRSLRKGGTLIVGIRSREAQFWQMFDPIMKEVEQKMNGRTMQFAHDIAEALRHAGLMTTRTSNEFHLDVPHESALIRVIEFLYRLPYGTVANSSQWRERIMAVANLQKHQFGSYRFAMTDDLFAIRKMQPLDNLTETSFLSGDLELNPWVH